MEGRRPDYLRDDDRSEVTRRMAALGYSDGQIAWALGCTRRSVLRIRDKLGIPAALPSQGGNRVHLRFDMPTRKARS